jgi:hypothetical protein
MNHEVQVQQNDDNIADSVASVVLILIFVATCIFWISGQ